jgi:hypothetical protein
MTATSNQLPSGAGVARVAARALSGAAWALALACVTISVAIAISFRPQFSIDALAQLKTATVRALLIAVAAAFFMMLINWLCARLLSPVLASKRAPWRIIVISLSAIWFFVNLLMVPPAVRKDSAQWQIGSRFRGWRTVSDADAVNALWQNVRFNLVVIAVLLAAIAAVSERFVGLHRTPVLEQPPDKPGA